VDTLHEFISYGSGHHLLTGEFYSQPKDMFFLLIGPDGKPKSFKLHSLKNGGGNFSVRPNGFDQTVVAGTYKMHRGFYTDDDKLYIASLDAKGNLSDPVVLPNNKGFWPYHVFKATENKSIMIGRISDGDFTGPFSSLIVTNDGTEPALTIYTKNKLSGPTHALQAPSGDIYAMGWDRKLGGKQKIWLTILSQDGKIKKEIKLRDVHFAGDFNLAMDSNGDLWLTGAHSQGDDWDFKQDLLVMKLSPNGKIKWKRIFPGPNDEQGSAIVPLPSGEIIVGTKTEGKDNEKFGLIKMSANGELIWELENKLPKGTEIEDMLLTNEGQLLIALNTKYTEDGSFDILLMRLE